MGGSQGPSDQPLVSALRDKLARADLLGEVDWAPNTSREEKIRFLQSLTLFSVPARFGEAFGLYLLEAWAAGVPAIQPRAAAFPELIEATGGGVLFEPERVDSLADALESLLRDPVRARAMGAAAREAVDGEFSVQRMADRMLAVFREATPGGVDQHRG